MGHLVQDHRLASRPGGSQRDRDRGRLRLVVSLELPGSLAYRHRTGIPVLRPHGFECHDRLDIGLDGSQIAEPPLHGDIDPGAEEVDDATPVEDRRPLVLGGIDGGGRHGPEDRLVR